MSKHWRLYNTAAWKRRRADQLARQPLCEFCLKEGRTTAATVADHKRRHNGNAELFHSIPLQSLCKPHHDSAKQAEEIAGFSKEAGLDGWPVDPSHPFSRPRP